MIPKKCQIGSSKNLKILIPYTLYLLFLYQAYFQALFNAWYTTIKTESLKSFESQTFLGKFF